MQSSESRAEQSRAEQSRAEQSRAEQSRAEQSRAEQSRAEQSRAAELTRAMDHRPDMPDTISAAPRKKSGKTSSRSSGPACLLMR